ncbi:hypothetical protein ACFLIM_39055 [Nonomuraea sp. M3C6]|uniref:Transposase, YhgA-like n=1 Tax=Nonomuraea marmarensis TaxID=3351344 RepID=A0ABW7ASJ3_9ACTN
MRYNTTPTNGLIEEAAELYVLLMAELYVPVICLVAYSGEPRKATMHFDGDHCDAVHNAVIFWHEGIAAPLVEAHAAAHALQDVSEARRNSNATPNSPYAGAARREVKRLRAIIAESDATIRRELDALCDALTRDI